MKKTLLEFCDEIEIWQTWLDNYKKYVPQFIQEAKTGKNWQDWDKSVFDEFFERSSDQCVASLKQGYFTNAEKTIIKENWPTIAPILKKIADNQDTPDWDAYSKIKDLIKQFTTSDRKAATNRLIASLQPKLLSTIVTEEHLWELFDKLKKNITDPLPTYEPNNWFKNSNNILRLFQNTLSDYDVMDIVTFSWQLLDYFRELDNANNEKKQIMNSYTELLKYKHQIILQGPPGTGKTYTAKDLAYYMIFNKAIAVHGSERDELLKSLYKSEQFRMVQFHPAYSYEDFVRGISASTTDNKVEYKTVNKILALLAKDALKNFNDSKKPSEELSIENWLDNQLEDFKETIQDAIDENEKYPLSKSAYIYAIEDEGFRYTGDNWSYNFKIPFSEIKKLFTLNIKERKDIKKQKNVLGSAKQHATYYFSLLSKFKDFIGTKTPSTSAEQKVELKNYVLIIDEINRANLPSVLGELIYSLEYRGEPVSSMYDIDGDREIIIPPNLYIIGTMNTADRSVGHIDYAIRRRFAFVDTLPLRSVIEKHSISNALEIFDKVSALFCKDFVECSIKLERSEFLSPDFNPIDVMIGHSYFLVKDDAKLKLKLKNEIKPILREYVKDGILIGDKVFEIIDNL